MDDLTIQDVDGDAFTLAIGDPAFDPVISMDDNVTEVNITEADAIRVVAWLAERFGLDEPESGSGPFGQSVTITVPGAAGGTTREVSWMGDGGAPEWLQALAGIALGGAVAVVPRENYDRVRSLNERNYTGWRDLIAELGASTPDGAMATARLLRNPDRWRKVLEALGAETPEVAAEIAQTWRTWLDEAGRILIREGVADATAQTAIDPVKALNLLLNRHAAALKKQTEYWSQRQREVAITNGSLRESMIAEEREVRAAVQVRLDDAERKLKIARDALEVARAEFYGIDEELSHQDISPMTFPAIVAKLDKALEDSTPAS